MEIINNKNTLSTKDVSKRLGICYATALKIMKGSDFPSFKIGSKIMVFEKDFDNWTAALVGKKFKIDSKKETD